MAIIGTEILQYISLGYHTLTITMIITNTH